MSPKAKGLRISWSGLQRYEDCKQRHLRVMTGKQAKVDGRVFLPGTVSDRAMRHWLDQDDPQPGGMLQLVDELFDHYTSKDSEYTIRWRGVNDKETLRNWIKELVRDLEPILYELVIPHYYHPELKFEVPIQIPYLTGNPTYIHLIGGIDIAVRRMDTDDYFLHDLKATANDEYMNKTLGQAIFYDIAFGHYIGDREQPKGFSFLAPKTKRRIFDVTISEDDRRFMMTRIINMAHGIWRKEWDPREKASGMVSCSQCDVKHACTKFMPHVTTDQIGQRRASFKRAGA